MPPRTYVMIPGAWHGGWSWRPVAERLRAAGHRAVTLTLPGLGDGDDPTGLRLRDAVDHIVNEVERLGLTDVVLVGHSWGGYPMTGAAHRLAGRVTGLVYYNAFVPRPGVSLLGENPPENVQLLQSVIDSSPTRSIPAGLEFVQQLFMPGADEDAQRLLAELLTPQPGAYFADALDIPEVTTLGIPARYVLSEDDRAMPRSGHEFAARLGLEPLMVPGTHESMLTHPDEVAKAILGD
ncbi:alpha/beta hydrolase [Planotetraspora sp. A-T 1434]|uniref:alpha/beta fold hydrolase n=1 Tax=Planotetraspora sp. A-T 1434 TaxID=2979219 RepID=UPI0021BE5096|nr:alpha/beta hydrolase [Planotetraspora sp. A-T 1434]MCT9931865.1 alpha/beta hydrolase [Planotetraspora sp. A-T 1434]